MKSVGLKKHPKKNLCISVKSVGQNFHRISRMNRRQYCLSDYSRICADIWPLANGSRPIYAAVVFGHADFADGADFFRGRVLSHRFHRFTQIFYGISDESLCPIPGGICNDRTGRLRENPCHPMMKKICVICEICVT